MDIWAVLDCKKWHDRTLSRRLDEVSQRPKRSSKKKCCCCNVDMKSMEIQDWFIQIYPGGALVILGTRPEDKDGKIWRSSPIVRRVTAKVLETHTGSRYVLKGNLSRSQVEEMTDPRAYPLDCDLVDKFLRGFPVKWRTYLTRFCETMKNGEVAGETKSESAIFVVTGERSKESAAACGGATVGSEDSSAQAESSSVHNDEDLARTRGQLRRRVEASRAKNLPKSTEVGKESEMEDVNVEKCINTEEGVVKETDVLDASMYNDVLSSMKRSSRGRLIKTPSASVSYDCDMVGNFIGLSPQLFSPKADRKKRGKLLQNLPGKQEVGKKAGKRKEASEGTTTPVAKKLQLENQPKLLLQKLSGKQAEKKVEISIKAGKKKEAPEGTKSPVAKKLRLENQPNLLNLRGKQAEKKVEISINEGKKKKALEGTKPPVAKKLRGKQAEKKVEISIKAGKKKEAPEGTKSPVAKKLRLENQPNLLLQNQRGKQAEKKVEISIKARKKKEAPEGTKSPVAKKLRLENQQNLLLQNLRGKQAEKKVEISNSSVPEPSLVLAKRGTLKRSRQIQEAIKDMDAGYSDDAFAEATPLKKAKVQFQNLDDAEDEDDDYEDSSEIGEDDSGEESPVTTWRQRLGAPLSTTPDLSVYDYDEPTVITSDERKAAVQIAYRIKRKKPLRVKELSLKTHHIEVKQVPPQPGTKMNVQDHQKKGKQANSLVPKTLAVATRKLDTLVDSDEDSENSSVESMNSDDSSCEDDILDTLY